MSSGFTYVNPANQSGASVTLSGESHGAPFVELTPSLTQNLSAYETSQVYAPFPSQVVSPSILLYKSVVQAAANTSMDVLLQGLNEFSDPTGTIDVYLNTPTIDGLIAADGNGKPVLNTLALQDAAVRFRDEWITNSGAFFTDAQGFVGKSAPATVSDDYDPPHAVPTLGQAIKNLGDQTLFLGSASNALAYGIPYGNSNDIVQSLMAIPNSSPLVNQLCSDASDAGKWDHATNALSLNSGDDVAFIVEVATTQRVQYTLSGVASGTVDSGKIEYYVAGQQFTISLDETNPADLANDTKTKVYYKLHFVKD
jgi:hypothetical protein